MIVGAKDSLGGWRARVIAGTLFFAVAMAFAFTWGWDLADDSWFLQVTNRFVSGESLYRDIYLPVTPLSIYALALPAAVFGAQILILKVEVALVFSGVALLACRINAQLGSKARYPLLLVVALVVLGSPARSALIEFYSHLANLFLFASFSLWLSWRAESDTRLIYAVGALLGACFVSKQNLGVYGVAALACSLFAVAVFEKRRTAWAVAALSRAAAAFIVVVSVVLAPVALTGGLPKLVDDGFIGRGTYLARGGMWYFAPIYSLGSSIRHPFSISALKFGNAALPFLLPFVVGTLLLIVFARDERRDRATTASVVAFTAAAMGMLFPRADPGHMIFAVPMLLVALAYSWRQVAPELNGSLSASLRAATAVTLFAALALMARSSAQRAFSGEYVVSRIPHFSGLLSQRAVYDGLQRNLAKIPALHGKASTFFIGPYASFYYLAGGMPNPTRYDYPTVISLRGNGADEIISAIDAGRIDRVCVDPGGDKKLEALSLKQYVRRTMLRLPQPDFCEQYASASRSELNSIPAEVERAQR